MLVLNAWPHYLASEVAKLKDQDTTMGTIGGACNLSKRARVCDGYKETMILSLT